ncbi:16S rRNA (cytidine(1402)-2'-O)-methyltransferase [Anaerobranca gottschalkii]|uniref:Ribosomal RNA small subunit methyltransferase I n=1 Tax=Anaerobranca gottschalkii DSM 13577 TaxID=1120990 RepID=A0A1I0BE91_9FIRM|nr:16S rRNA (cytidine(1402)-2'-O)-methyltransferase [Anaerobranca gottschalkii]SET05186.1 16S rRNA (cytidine1402-2'-O)-methyltransferase [Anaerobranca gottschalkii DSM 13577]
MVGKLYLCATPIGNLEDISARAIKILQEVDYIAAEDTRRTGLLLNHFSIKTPMLQYHKFNEKKQVLKIINKILEGYNVALVSDAGTPGIADPGQILVEKALENNIQVIPIPGPCALICALIISGFDTTNFKFVGFLPKGNQKGKELEKLLLEPSTIVCYQSPHDLLDTLEKIDQLHPNRKIVVVRELTKIYEERLAGTASELINIFKEKGVKGEFTLVIEGNNLPQYTLEQGIAEVETLLEQGYYLKDACKHVGSKMGLSQRELYQHMLKKDS